MLRQIAEVETNVTAPPKNSPSSKGHRPFQSLRESSLMGVTPHIETASKTCSEEMPKTPIPPYYLSFRDRN
jgi:hypothetical protein